MIPSRRAVVLDGLRLRQPDESRPHVPLAALLRKA
jgi:hypothetical protein